jgi:hypothetical protein
LEEIVSISMAGCSFFIGKAPARFWRFGEKRKSPEEGELLNKRETEK